MERTPIRFGPVDVSVSDGRIRVSFGEDRADAGAVRVRVPDGVWHLDLGVEGGSPVERELDGPGWVQVPLP